MLGPNPKAKNKKGVYGKVSFLCARLQNEGGGKPGNVETRRNSIAHGLVDGRNLTVG